MKRTKRKAGRPFREGSQNLRDEILNAFLVLCWQDGVESITLQKIADESKVALTSVRYHFQQQGDSLSRVAGDYVSDKTYEYLDRSILDARSKKNFDPVNAYVNAQFKWIAEQPMQASFHMYYYYLCTTKVSLKIQNSELIEIGRRRVLSFIHEGIGMGLYSLIGSADAVSIDVHTYITGACFQAATCRNVEFSKNLKNLCFDYVARLLKTKIQN